VVANEVVTVQAFIFCQWYCALITRDLLSKMPVFYGTVCTSHLHKV